MPLYEYEDLTRPGRRFTHRCDVNERDNVPGARRILATPTILANRTTQEAQAGKNTIRGYYKEEQKNGSRFRSSFTPDQIKRAWSN
jgi:hypothetical protein